MRMSLLHVVLALRVFGGAGFSPRCDASALTRLRASPEDAAWMLEAVELAKEGGNATAPNPNVGCVIVGSDGAVVGRGFHPKAGAPHAEIYALRDAGATVERDPDNDKRWKVDSERSFEDCTAYVTLEPCNHYGRTPPCARALVDAGVARVVVGFIDPDPRVSGGGIQTLLDAGIEVAVGCEEALCREINADFIARQVAARDAAR